MHQWHFHALMALSCLRGMAHLGLVEEDASHVGLRVHDCCKHATICARHVHHLLPVGPGDVLDQESQTCPPPLTVSVLPLFEQVQSLLTRRAHLLSPRALFERERERREGGRE